MVGCGILNDLVVAFKAPEIPTPPETTKAPVVVLLLTAPPYMNNELFDEKNDKFDVLLKKPVELAMMTVLANHPLAATPPPPDDVDQVTAPPTPCEVRTCPAVPEPPLAFSALFNVIGVANVKADVVLLPKTDQIAL